jgi:hypothetical protein
LTDPYYNNSKAALLGSIGINIRSVKRAVLERNIIECDYIDFDAGAIVHTPIRIEYTGEAESLQNIKLDGSLVRMYTHDFHRFQTQLEDEVNDLLVFSLLKK